MGKLLFGTSIAIGAVVGGGGGAYAFSHDEMRNAANDVMQLQECINGDRELTVSSDALLYCGGVQIDEVAEDTNNDGVLERVPQLQKELDYSLDLKNHHFRTKGFANYIVFMSIGGALGALAALFVSGEVRPPKKPKLEKTAV